VESVAVGEGEGEYASAGEGAGVVGRVPVGRGGVRGVDFSWSGIGRVGVVGGGVDGGGRFEESDGVAGAGSWVGQEVGRRRWRFTVGIVELRREGDRIAACDSLLGFSFFALQYPTDLFVLFRLFFYSFVEFFPDFILVVRRRSQSLCIIVTPVRDRDEEHDHHYTNYEALLSVPTSTTR